MSEYNEGRNSRSMVARILFGVLWFVPICFAINVLLGSVVGGIARASGNSYDSGAAAGRVAATHFFQEYGTLVLFGQVLITAGLSVAGILPGTARWKRAK